MRVAGTEGSRLRIHNSSNYPSRTRVRLRTFPRLWVSRRRRRIITARSAGVAFVVVAKNPCRRRHVPRSQVSITNWRDNEVPDQGVGVSECLQDAASIGAVGDVEFGSYFLLRQDEQAIPTHWFTENPQQIILRISNVPKLQLGYRPCLGMVLPKAL